jgi:hypothetical protein
METWGSKVKKALARLNKVNNYLYNKPEQEWTHQDKALAISFLRKAKVAENMKDLKQVQEFFSKPLPEQTQEDPTDIIAMDVPLFIRMLEWAREDAETDMELHDAAERAIEAVKLRGLLSMEDYIDIVGKPSVDEETGYSKYLATPENPKGKTPGLTPDIMGKILMKIATMGDDDVEETTRLGEGVIYEELCPKGKAYIKKRQAAGEKSSAYLSGRAVKVCKGQMEG